MIIRNQATNQLNEVFLAKGYLSSERRVGSVSAKLFIDLNQTLKLEL
ncbi:hypothetical protein CLW00_105282 [Mongoliibacter ruber]|uniref:Uncharacterized protein n=1 Tax=Mongoliibacter ruber TaxID=1750599 RepID=A0A2T0WN98_9BACT|nr:hypothetical protein CLW00_105282 [Mongoliibacter ruber]